MTLRLPRLDSARTRLFAAALVLFLSLTATAQPVQEAAPVAAAATPTGPSFDIDVRAPDEARELLQRHLELYRYREVRDLDDSELARLIVLAERNARELLGTMGYFSPELRITREPGPRTTVVISVELGERTIVRDVDIAFEGAVANTTNEDTLEQRKAIQQGWGLPVGQPFTQERWDDAKLQALSALSAERFLAGRVSYSIADIDAATNVARLGLRLDSGPVYRLGPLQVTGTEKYDERLVPRLARLEPGSEYDRDELVQAQLRLTGSGYYDSAFIFVDPDGDPAAVPVQVTVREAPLQKLVLGVGLTTDSGPRLTAKHTHNRLPTIGWRAVSEIQLDRKRPFLQSELTSIPGEDGWRWSVLGRAERLEDDDLITQGRRLRFGRFRSEDNIDRNMYVQYDRARVRSVSGEPVDPAESGSGSALSANYIWSGRYFDDLPSPSGGWGLSVELGGGVTLDGDRKLFQRTLARGLYLYPLERGRLQLRGEAGAVLADDDARVPATQLFRTGGDTSVRGYGYRDIGVELPDGRIGPGRFVVVGSLEWQRPIRRGGVATDFESVVFIDGGAVANEVRDLSPVYGVGAGVRWRSPVGPVEIALAYGVEPRRLRLHLNVGFQF